MSSAKARCLIISANCAATPYPVYPLGASYITGALQHHGHDAVHFDVLADGGFAALKDLLKAQTFDLIGLSMRNLDNVDSSAPNSFIGEMAQAIELVRSYQLAPVVLGGPAFSIMPEVLMEHLQADYGIVGEGETLLPWLTDQIISGKRPEQAIHYSNRQHTCWQPAPLTASTATYYTNHGGMLNVQTKRGCPFGCSYCSYPAIEGGTIRFRDAQDVVDEVERLQAHSHARYIFFTDSVFNDHQGKYLEIAEALIQRDLNIPWCGFFRPAGLGAKELKILKRAGLAAMELGTDALTDTTLNGLNKQFTMDDVFQVNHAISQADIPCSHFVIFGGPGETAATVQEGLENAEQLGHCVIFAFIGIRVLPNTAIATRAVAEGLLEEDQSLLHPMFYFSPEVDKHWLEQQVLHSFNKRIDRIYPCNEFETKVAMLHQMGHAGPLWDLLLKMKGK